jgi:hypothetical protein
MKRALTILAIATPAESRLLPALNALHLLCDWNSPHCYWRDASQNEKNIRI